MEKLKQEFLLHAFVMSFVLSGVLAAIGAAIEVNQSEFGNRDDWFIPFVVLWLFQYVFNLAVSLLNYGLGRKFKSLGFRLAAFHAVGLSAAGAAWVCLDGIIALAVFSTFVLFSLATVIFHRIPSRSHS